MTILLADVVAADSAYESTNLALARTSIPLTFSAALGDVDVIGSTSVDVPVYTPPAAPEDGNVLFTSMDDWYFRIHFVPRTIDFGNMSGDQQRTMIVWNAFFVPADLESFDLLNGDGITVDTDVVPPVTLAPLQVVDYAFTASVTGPAVIDATASWVIDGVTYDIPIIGRRTTLFPFAPEWSRPVQETLEWKTTVQATFSGHEQRVRIRYLPRRIFDYQIRIHDDNVQLFDVLTFGWVGRMFALPLGHEKVKLQADAGLGDQTLYLDTANVSFAAGSSAVLFAGPQDNETVQIVDVFADHITLQGPLARAWPAGSRVLPVMAAVPPATFSTVRRVPAHLDAGVRFIASPADAVLRLPEVAADATYLGEELYTKETNWRENLAIKIDARRNDIDNGLGPIRLRPKATFPLVTRGMTWMLKTRAEAETLRAFFVRRAGRQVPVWMPSGVADLTLVEPIDAGQTTFYVDRTEYSNLIAQHPARRHLIFLLRDGTRYARRIVGVTAASEGRSLVQVDTSFPAAVALANVKRLSYLGLYRLGSDSVTFTWHTDRVAEVDVQFVLTEPSA